MMARLQAISAAIVLAVLFGCDTPKELPPAPTVNSAVVGKWVVDAVNGKPVAPGTEIRIEYLSDGKVVVEATGDAAPALDREELKRALDQVTPPRAQALNSFKITVGGSELQLRWDGPPREAPQAPVPPGKNQQS